MHQRKIPEVDAAIGAWLGYANFVSKPGPGWRHLQGAVWAHDKGPRIHVLGKLIRYPNGECYTVQEVSEGPNLWLLLYLINGRNEKRAMMAFARTISGI